MEKAIADTTDPKDVQRLTKRVRSGKGCNRTSQTLYESSKAKLRAYKEEATGLAQTTLATMKSELKQTPKRSKTLKTI